MLGGAAGRGLAVRLNFEANDDLNQRLGRYSEPPFSILVNKSG
jgi:hypothetical protein